jgi:hypothetical protein
MKAIIAAALALASTVAAASAFAACNLHPRDAASAGEGSSRCGGVDIEP